MLHTIQTQTKFNKTSTNCVVLVRTCTSVTKERLTFITIFWRYVEFVKIYELEFEEFLLPLHTILVGGIFVKWHYYCWLYL